MLYTFRLTGNAIVEQQAAVAAEWRFIMRNKFLDALALTIAIVGAVNWGLIGIFRFDLVAFIFGDMSWVSRIIYTLVGLCGLYLVTFYMRLSDDTTT